DPYGNVPFPSHGSCTASLNYSSTTAATISPGTYCNLSISAGAQITMNPGTYIFTGNVNVSGGGELPGHRVTLSFTWNAAASFTGGGAIHLTAPTTGATAGMIMFGDSSTTANFNLSGANSFLYTGAIYLPKASVTISGGSTAASPTCNQVIA